MSNEEHYSLEIIKKFIFGEFQNLSITPLYNAHFPSTLRFNGKLKLLVNSIASSILPILVGQYLDSPK